ncbi:MAG TPA: replication-associated recombination protein A [Candidatus Polarisedimenticolia bacterium]|jgi:putative ATPase|nr:replication-associated recombination protein A [Candidatus Polarisedimenticolia bacterium]
MDLFDRGGGSAEAVSSAGDPPPGPRAPLAERLRPERLDDIVGQPDLLNPDRPFRRSAESGRLASMILWGPPGSGKTTLARVVASASRARLVGYSAVLSGIREIKDVMTAAERAARAQDRPMVLFIDEIHRFNRAQQDAFLPHVERGTIVLIGATTENPSFSINAALLSRCAVHVLRPLGEEDLLAILKRALVDPRGLADGHLTIDDPDLRLIAARSSGDARRALNALEAAALLADRPTGRITRAAVEGVLARAALVYDKEGEEHYNLISALHKSLRNGDADAGLYWLGRMLESGEDPLYVTRRLVRFASEDVGNADPEALHLALAAHQAVQAIGLPEAALALAQAVVWLAAAPKSNTLLVAYGRVLDDLRAGFVDPVPLAVRNATTGLMRDLGYGRGYVYAHDTAEETAHLDCLPERLKGRRYYEAKTRGAERALGERLEALRQAREERPDGPGGVERSADEAGPGDRRERGGA